MPTAAKPKIGAADLTALRKFTSLWVSTCVANDWDKLASMLTDDVVLLPPDAPVVKGKKAARAFLDAFPRVREMTATIAQAQGQGDFAWARGPYSFLLEGPGGKPLKLVGKWSATYRKQSDGRWMISSDMWNNDHPIT